MHRVRLPASPFVQALALALLATLISLVLYAAGALNWLDWRIGDWRTRLTASAGPATERVVTIIVDQNSLDDAESLFGLGWPWPREVYGHMLAFCERGGAAAVVFDLVYTEHSRYGVSDDATFASALAAPLPSVIPLPLGRQMGTTTQWPEMAARPVRRHDPVPSPLQTIWQQPTASLPVPELAAAATVLGNVVATPDPDAVFRKIAPFVLFDDVLVPSLGQAAYLAAHPETHVRFGKNSLFFGDTRVPLDRNGNVRLRFRGPSQTHRAFNATAILQSELRLLEGGTPLIDPDALQDAYVLVGLTAPGLMDLKPTPMGRTYPGVEVHATALDNLLSQDFYREVPFPLLLLAVLLLALLATVSIRLTKLVSFSAGAVPVFTVLPIAAAFPLDKAGIWLPVAPLLVGGILASLAAILTNYALEGQQKRFIKNAFKQYLSPDVIDSLLRDPNALKLGGEEKTLTIFFSDVQGFTSISEKLSPQQLTALLNEYLTAMTDIILASGGTIDKYEGDAIIAFWNAPIDQPDHAERGVRAALACQARLAAMRADLRQRYGSDLFVRIGLNTGPVVVGNMGSNLRFDYTFLGDAGNLAARLEGINKQFGTFLLISQATQEALPPDLPVRKIATVRVVGKARPVTVLEPYAPDAYKPQALQDFEEALLLVQNGQFADALPRFEALAAQDAVAGSYAQRCQKWLKEPPADWDGVINLTEK